MLSIAEIVADCISYSEEQNWFEYKDGWYEPDGIGEYISSLSNAAAMLGKEEGYLIWGIHNSTHELTDTKFNYHQDVKNEPLEHYLARNITPGIYFRFDEDMIDGKRVVVLRVPAAHTVPTAYKTVRYLRIGSSKVNLAKFPEREAELFRVLNTGLPNLVNTESRFTDLTFDQLFLYYDLHGIKLNKKSFKKNLELLTKDGKYNMLAQLLSDEPHIPIRFAVFSGKDKTSTMYTVREFGNMCLLMSLDKVLDFGDTINIPQADERDRKVERKEVMLFDKDAFHEAVINAFVHNMWVNGDAPMFTAYEDRIEIVSLGTLPPNQTKEGFFGGVSIPVNQKLSEILLQLHISEKSGRGVPRITAAYGEEAFQFKDNAISVTIPFARLNLWNSTYGNPQDNPQDNPQEDRQIADNVSVRIIDFCKEAHSIREIAKMLGYKDRKTVHKYLDPLLESGIVARTIPDKPNSRNQKYISISK